MSAPVDVLAVLSRRANELTRKYGADNDLAAVRSAVDELIEADEAYDDAMARHYHAIHYGRDAQHLTRCAMKAKEAAVRRAAALARVRGEA